MIAIRLTVAHALRAVRKPRCASPRVALNHAIRAILVPGLDGVATSAAFNPAQCPRLGQLRARAQGSLYY